MMKTTFATIVLERSDLYKNICEIFWDLIDEEWSEPDMFNAIRSPEQMIKALGGGMTPMLLGLVMDQLECLEESKTPFVIIIMDGNEVWATINGKDIRW